MHSLTITDYQPGMQPAYLANGLVGLRIGANPLCGATALLNGFVGVHEANALEAYAYAPYPVGADLALNGIWLSARQDGFTFREQSYDFACGELTSRFDVSLSGVTAHVEVLTFCSRSLPTITAQEITLTVDAPVKLTLRAKLDPRGLPGRSLLRSMPREGVDAVLQWESRGGIATCGAAFISEYLGEHLLSAKRNNWGYEDDFEVKDYLIDARPGETYRLRQLGSLAPSLMHAEPHWQAMRLVAMAAWQGYDKVRADNRAAWQELWQGRIIALGAGDHWQQVLDAAYFYLHSTVHQATPSSVAPFGLGQRDHYLGHVFWDTETFMYPPVLLTAPHAARAMMDYRSRMLQSAKYNAALYGYRGLQFPWQSGNHGGEVTPIWAFGGSAEIHINLDVAFAFAQYCHASGDELFIRQQAWPVLEGVAEWLMSRVTETARGYEIRHVVGIDEGLENVHNNAYTNMASIVILREASALAKRLGFTPPPTWLAVAERIFIPIDSELGIIRKHDSYTYTGGMCVPETLAAFFPLNFSYDKTIDEATIDYHLELAQTYLGMPMLSALLGVYAARRGKREFSRQLFEAGIFPHLAETFMQFSEGSADCQIFSSTPTPFLSNPAGMLMACYYGFTGLELGPGDPQSWCKHPVVMPEGWDGIEVEHIWVRGQRAHLRAMHGAQHAELSVISDQPLVNFR